jgi:hypothetical protein
MVSELSRHRLGLVLLLGIATAAVIALLMIIAYRHATPPDDPSRDEKHECSVDEVLDLIDKCPPWSSFSADDDAVAGRIISSLRELHRCDLDSLRRAIVTLIKREEERGGLGIEPMTKLFVLNRYLFEVPSQESVSEPHFGGWHIPTDGEWEDRMWPLSVHEDGMVLSGMFFSYTGPPYDALDEFDYFRSKYGPRRTFSRR